jgi:hypothetical protein
MRAFKVIHHHASPSLLRRFKALKVTPELSLLFFLSYHIYTYIMRLPRCMDAQCTECVVHGTSGSIEGASLGEGRVGLAVFGASFREASCRFSRDGGEEAEVDCLVFVFFVGDVG